MPGPFGRIGADLLPRVASGLVLIAVAIVLVVLGGPGFAVLLAAAGVAIAWEWGRIVRGGFDAATCVHAAAVLAAIVFGAMGKGGAALLALGVGAVLVGVLTVGLRPALSATGVLYAGLPALALLWLRADMPYGLRAVLYLMAVVIATDTAAYFCGRLIGGPKLWPAVSPKKTWSGLLGGVAAAALTGVLFAPFVMSGGTVPLAIGGAILAVVSQAGDMAESALKRRFDVKDASGLIPGHGGVMDRADGLIAAAVGAALFAAAIDMTAPARALLIWS